MRLAGRTISRTAIAVAGMTLAAATLLTLVIDGGEAAKPRVPSTVSLHSSADSSEFTFRGRVRSDEGVCERL